MTNGHQIILASRPKALPTPENFRLESMPIPEPAAGEFLLASRYLSLDPYMRGKMDDPPSYPPAIGIGEPMIGEAIAEILESRHPDYQIGELVRASIGCRTHAVAKPDEVNRIETGGNAPTTALGVLGMPGFTAYVGLNLIGQPKPSETVVVAAASGAVGSLVDQLARIAGARAVGIAGGAEKCAYVRDHLGFDAVVDHRNDDLPAALASACPDGIDVYFENVGGKVWEAVLPLLNHHSRVPVCGLIAHYNDTGSVGTSPVGRTMLAVLRRNILVHGFSNTAFLEEHHSRFIAQVAPLIAEGRLRHQQHIVEGLAAAPAAFIDMLTGRSLGKASCTSREAYWMRTPSRNKADEAMKEAQRLPVEIPWHEAMRASFTQIVVANPPARDVRSEPELLDGLPALRVWTSTGSAERIVYYLHGGGFVAGSPATHLTMLGEIARGADAHVIALDYAKAPERPFPAAYEDTIRGLRAVMASGGAFAVAGDSCGGGLALAALAEAARTGSGALRAGAVISPWVDMTLSAPSLQQLAERDPVVSAEGMQRLLSVYAPGIDVRDARLSPAFGLLEGLPPLLIQVGSNEVLLDDALLIDRMARAAGAEVHLEVWAEMLHVWHLSTASRPQASQALHRVGDFLKSRLGSA